jgi:hypothetical protein
MTAMSVHVEGMERLQKCSILCKAYVGTQSVVYEL